MKQLTLLRARTSIQLGQAIGRGGEGVVYAIEGQNDRVAKIYSTQPEIRKVQKLVAMAEAGTPALLRIAAWPIDLLADNKGNVQGFIMPRIVARRDIHELYSPKSRSEAFPEANFRFLSHVGANIARAFAVVHEHGQVLGDVNHGNLLVGSDGTVMLIDCDSFQIGIGPNAFTCDVGVPLFTAPELQGRNFRNLLRSPNHDLFGLAVLLFHLLYMGRHPFAGRYSGVGDMPIEKAIAEYRFAYGPDRITKGMERPPGTIALEILGSEIAQNFTNAFSQFGSSGSRPDAKKWVTTLENLKNSLHECSVASWHHYPNGLGACPWCVVEAQTSVRLFGHRIIVGTEKGVVDVAMLWQAIVAVPRPGSEPPLPSQREWTLPPGVEIPSKTLKYLRIAIGMVLACSGLVACNVLAKDGGTIWAAASLFLTLLIWPRVSNEKRRGVEQSYAAANTKWQAALGRWNQEAKEEIFTAKFKALERAYSEFLDIPNERQRRLAKLEANREKLQRELYLDRFRIDLAKIPGIGPGRTAMLASYGIETANDIDAIKIKRIPGFGEVRTLDLIVWRKQHEQNFRFNPSIPIDRRFIDALDGELEARRQALLATLRQGANDLRRISQEIIAARPRLMPMMEKTWEQFKVTEAQWKAL
ncbi:MAG: hypothetical protein U0Y68_13420 [Blastocatellia bacterium]